MLAAVRQDLSDRLSAAIRDAFGVEHIPVLEIPARRDLGDFAAPAGLHLARELKRPPREIAAAIVDKLALPETVREVRVEGPGYLNIFLRRSPLAAALFAGQAVPDDSDSRPKVVVEHTNINPNKAAHIGHLRNAVLGDVLARALRSAGTRVEIQNYIDDTGVQLADVVVGFMDIRGFDLDTIAALPEPFDYACWDLYSEVGEWYEADPERDRLRRQTLHQMESGEGDRSAIARLVSERIVGRHLKTMGRLGIGYDLLTHESEILRLDFFARAFELLKQSGAIHLEESGKNVGCWVMPLAQSAEFEGLEDPDKVIVRSDGTVTYVGKDIAYQLWKFGLLERDFEYAYWKEQGVWQTAAADGSKAPPFGRAGRVINVIDARQSYLQKIVRAGLEALGYAEQAEQSIHFAYEMVALSSAAAEQLGVPDAGGEGRAQLMSGRKGIGVKADDLLDQLEAKARDSIAERNRDLDSDELDRLSREIAVAALRFLMVKATTTRIIAFDFEEALSFEGETGPYLQYSLVRESNIQRRLAEAGIAGTLSTEAVATLDEALWEDDLWDLVFSIAQIPETVTRASEGLELSMIARHAIEVARKFHSIYHRHPILQEEDPNLRAVRLATNQIFRNGLGEVLGILGIPIPTRM